MLALTLLMSISLGGIASLASDSRCERVAIPLRSALTSKVIEMTGTWISSSPQGVLEADISIRYSGDKSVSRVIVVVNYFDESGSILLSIPFQANVPSEKEPRNLRPFSALLLNDPIKPGQELTLTGKNLLSVTKTPSSAEIVYWQARFPQGGSSESTSLGLQGERGFRTDPILAEAPSPYLGLSFPHPAEPAEVLVKLRINEYGRVLDVHPERKEESEFGPDQLEALSQQLLKWHFSPATENGYVVPSELYLLVDLLPENPLPVRHCFLEHPDKYPQKFAFVILEPIPDSTYWIPYYAGFPVGGKLETTIIKMGRAN
jgi:hypothetical protein